MSVPTRTLDTIDAIVDVDLQRLAQSAVDGGHYWQQRAERAEALLRAYVDYACVMVDEYSHATCSVCYGGWNLGEKERHAKDCPVARARALLEVLS